MTNGDPMQGLTRPVPRPVAMTEGIAELGNVRLWYWDAGGPGEAIVLLHPRSGSCEVYPHQRPAFAEVGYRVISYSRRGQHKSDIGTDADDHFAADDLLGLMDHLGVRRFHAVGNALGGYVGLDAALSHPERILSLVLACSMMGISEPEFVERLQALRPKAFHDLPPEVRELSPSYRAANPAGVAQWLGLHERAGAGAPVRLRNTITWQSLAALRVPTLLVTGDADLWMPPYLLRLVAEKLPASEAVVVPACGHAVQWEQPEIFNRTVLGFIGTAAARRLDRP